MGMINTDVSIDYYGSASGARYFGQPASVSKSLSWDELPMSQLFSLGSGGEANRPFFTPATGSNVHVKQAKNDSLSTVVDEICMSFNLSKDELSKACNIRSRKTLYNWIDGVSKPRKKTMGRLFELLMLSRRVQSSGLTASKDLMHQKINNGKSVLDMLSDELIDDDLVVFSLSRLSLINQNVTILNDPFA